MEQFEGTTLAEAVAWVLSRREEGVGCPCCEQYAKVYRRRVTSAMAFALVLMWQRSLEVGQVEWLHVSKFLKGRGLRGGDYGKMRFWGLIVPKSEIRPDGSNRSGRWRITEDGIGFASNGLEIEKYAFVYNNEALRFEGEWVNVVDALGTAFNYQEIIGRS